MSIRTIAVPGNVVLTDDAGRKSDPLTFADFMRTILRDPRLPQQVGDSLDYIALLESFEDIEEGDEVDLHEKDWNHVVSIAKAPQTLPTPFYRPCKPFFVAIFDAKKNAATKRRSKLDAPADKSAPSDEPSGN